MKRLVIIISCLVVAGCAIKKVVMKQPSYDTDVIVMPPIPGESSRTAMAIVVPPAQYITTNVNVTWSSTGYITSHNVYIYTNKNFYSWSNKVSGSARSFSRTIIVLDNNEFTFARVEAVNEMGKSLSYQVRDPDWLANAVEIDCKPRPVDAWICVTKDNNNWAMVQTNFPMTNEIDFTVAKQMYRVLSSVPTEVSIKPVRVWNGKYYGL